MLTPAYEIGPGYSWIKCLTCGKTSYNINDALQRYCVFCHVFHPGAVTTEAAGHDFSKGERGRFFRPGAEFRLPPKED